MFGANWGSELPLFMLSAADLITLWQVFEGIVIFGGTGSGKSSGSGYNISASLLLAGCGGIVLCAKSNERARWEALARKTGRSASIVTISPNHAWHFNIFDYALNQAGLVETIVTIFAAIRDMMATRHSPSNEGFWHDAANMLIRNAIPVLQLSTGRLSLSDLVKLVLSSPIGDEVEDTIGQRRNAFFWQSLKMAKANAKTTQEHHNLAMAERYWLEDFARLADRTRSSVVATFTTMGDVLLHDFLYDLFSTDTTIVPETTYRDGSILILDFPIREYGEAGVLAQKIFKFMFQQSILRRDISKYPRPVFLYCDEAHNFITKEDYIFQSEARESRAATVYITQNISNYYAALGTHGREEVNALMGHFQTKIFHANSDPATNQWAAEMIGRESTARKSWGASSNTSGIGLSVNESEQRDYKVEPAMFTTLRKGGAANEWQSDAIVFQSGRRFNATGEPWLKASFSQPQAIRVLPNDARPNAEPEASGDQAATRLTPGKFVWLMILLLEWWQIMRQQGQRVGDLLGGDYLQSLVQREPEALDNIHPVTAVIKSVPVPPPNMEETVKRTMSPSDDENIRQDAEAG